VVEEKTELRSELDQSLEALLFLSSEPLTKLELSEVLEVSDEDLKVAFERLTNRYREGDSGIVLREVAGGYSLATAPAVESVIRRLFATPKQQNLTKAQAETLAIVAYTQPVSRPEIAKLRGVNVDTATSILIERGLIEESGRSPFGAALFRTSSLFLKQFGLKSIDDLPDIQQWDPSPNEAGDLRERLMKIRGSQATTS